MPHVSIVYCVIIASNQVMNLVVQSEFAGSSLLGELAPELLPLTILVVAGCHLLQMSDGLRRVETLGTACSAIHDTMATVELHGIVQPGQTLVGHVIARIDDPTVGLLQHSGSQVVLRIPPVGRARCGAARAQN